MLVEVIADDDEIWVACLIGADDAVLLAPVNDLAGDAAQRLICVEGGFFDAAGGYRRGITLDYVVIVVVVRIP